MDLRIVPLGSLLNLIQCISIFRMKLFIKDLMGTPIFYPCGQELINTTLLLLKKQIKIESNIHQARHARVGLRRLTQEM